MKWLIFTIAITLIILYFICAKDESYTDDKLGMTDYALLAWPGKYTHVPGTPSWRKEIQREHMTIKQEHELCEKMRKTFKIQTGITWGTAPKDVQLEYLKLECKDNTPVAYDPRKSYPSYGTREYKMHHRNGIGGDPELTLGG